MQVLVVCLGLNYRDYHLDVLIIKATHVFTEMVYFKDSDSHSNTICLFKGDSATSIYEICSYKYGLTTTAAI